MCLVFSWQSWHCSDIKTCFAWILETPCCEKQWHSDFSWMGLEVEEVDVVFSVHGKEELLLSETQRSLSWQEPARNHAIPPARNISVYKKANNLLKDQKALIPQ